jgi:hypothetical protein
MVKQIKLRLIKIINKILGVKLEEEKVKFMIIFLFKCQMNYLEKNIQAQKL